ncbi:hypothetical protein [Micromonospora sp. ATCC 39149]|uniref:hypothetical protein n=1 Tax=Micromonospora sp. (strain ATCC 39149 / NRRL 15099 / SCC 1413) TaxID=219305 RepID=UPI0012FBA7E7|nr:hypothetical protein [Micromonospora sp. ATCC 39149]
MIDRCTLAAVVGVAVACTCQALRRAERDEWQHEREHYQDVIESMAADIEADERRHQTELERVRLEAVTEAFAAWRGSAMPARRGGRSGAGVLASSETAERRQAMEAHLRDQLAAEIEERERARYAEGYADGMTRREQGAGG